MSAENTKDSFYQLFVSANGEASSFKKVERLIKCGAPSEAKVLDEITATDDRRTVKAAVDFKEESELEFEYVLLPDDTTHQLLQTSFEQGKELVFQIKFLEATGESRQFKGMIAELTTDAEDTKKKIRKKGKITITGDVVKELTS
ncbi:hypothetical protein ACSF86_08725 [Moraxella bovoculi]|uniref:hypothetical protein n=1 Tax=Moraxella bovoculi TaxID=386891 RepID=UPI003F504FDA